VELFLQRASDKGRLNKSISKEMQPDIHRTRVAKEILKKVRNAALSNKEDASQEVAKLIDENSNSSRIAAIAILQGEPDQEYFPFLHEVIAQPHSAFEQYQALETARLFLPVLSDEKKSQLKTVIETQRGDQPGQYIKPGSARSVLSDMILRKLP
jgi:hypothetical protein